VTKLTALTRHPGVPFNVFAPYSSRIQCVSIAKSTGKQCGGPAMNGSKRCRVHGGRADRNRALKAAGKAPPVSPRELARMELYGMERPEGFPERTPGGFDLERLNPTTLRKGWLAYANRVMDPGSWRSWLQAAPVLPRRSISDREQSET
jgi:hypothetical protein